MTLSVAGSNKRILVAASVFFSLLIVLLAPDGCLSYGPLSSTSIPGLRRLSHRDHFWVPAIRGRRSFPR